MMDEYTGKNRDMINQVMDPGKCMEIAAKIDEFFEENNCSLFERLFILELIRLHNYKASPEMKK